MSALVLSRMDVRTGSFSHGYPHWFFLLHGSHWFPSLSWITLVPWIASLAWMSTLVPSLAWMSTLVSSLTLMKSFTRMCFYLSLPLPVYYIQETRHWCFYYEIIQASVAKNLLCGGRKFGNRQNEGKTDRHTHEPSTVTLAAHAHQGLITEAVLQRWLEGTGGTPQSWATLTVLKDIARP